MHLLISNVCVVVVVVVVYMYLVPRLSMVLVIPNPVKYKMLFSEFADFFNAVHGNCFVFNSNWRNAKRKPYTISQSGEKFGAIKILKNK